MEGCSCFPWYNDVPAHMVGWISAHRFYKINGFVDIRLIYMEILPGVVLCFMEFYRHDAHFYISMKLNRWKRGNAIDK